MHIIFTRKHPAAALVQQCYAAAARLLSLPEKVQVELLFVSPKRMRGINAAQRGKDSVTDVLSFPTLELRAGQRVDTGRCGALTDPETGCVMLGSVCICSARAAAQAARYGHGRERETAYLAVHGLLHLLGYDHMTDADKAAMREREEAVLNAAGFIREPRRTEKE